jgi:hypothetical protein
MAAINTSPSPRKLAFDNDCVKEAFFISELASFIVISTPNVHDRHASSERFFEARKTKRKKRRVIFTRHLELSESNQSLTKEQQPDRIAQCDSKHRDQ